MRFLLLLFIIVPIVEMWLLITVGQHIGALPTIGLVLLTAFIGVSLLRYQGAAALLTARAKINSGELPARELADGVFLAVGGALLLTPGFVTDVVGFACLTPGIRTAIMGFFARHVSAGSFQSQSHPHTPSSQSSTQSSPRHSFEHSDVHDKSSSSSPTRIIEGDFERDKD